MGHEEQLVLKGNFQLVNQLVYDGMWNLLEIFFAGAWWMIRGLALHRQQFAFQGILAFVTGVSCFLDGLSGVFELSWLHTLALNAYLVRSVLWAIAFGSFLLSGPLRVSPLDEPAIP